MDLGATVCSARDPECARCPLRRSCRWHRAGRPEPDPGSIPVGSRQSRFDGSDRQGRGRLVRALALGPIEAARIPIVMGWPEDPARAARVLEGLVGDGLAARDASGAYRLP
jgi:A/G-specific adenine glycosylase